VRSYIWDRVRHVKSPIPGTLKGSENTSELKSGTCLVAPGYAGIQGWIIWFFELTLFQGFHTLLGLRPGMDSRLPGYMRVIELSAVSP